MYDDFMMPGLEPLVTADAQPGGRSRVAIAPRFLPPPPPPRPGSKSSKKKPVKRKELHYYQLVTRGLV